MAFSLSQAGSSSPAAAAAQQVVEVLDRPLDQFGFVFDCFTPTKVSGRLTVTERCCQPFNMMHGGLSALIAEATASLGGILASGGGKAMGIQLSINHLKGARLGDVVFAEATPVTVGRTIQVWEVKLWKSDPSKSEGEKEMTASSRVTLMISRRMSDVDKNAAQPLKNIAKL